MKIGGIPPFILIFVGLHHRFCGIWVVLGLEAFEAFEAGQAVHFPSFLKKAR